jgi:DNA-binding GntR family transcriptional regulator
MSAGLPSLGVRVERVAAPVREQVLNQLRRAILDMRLRPAERLVERELVEQTGTSRTTVREVLRQLDAEGLVTTVPNRGTVVAAVTRERAAELYEVRAVLEAMAARQFAERASAAQRRALRRSFATIEAVVRDPAPQPLLEAKRDFYDVLFQGAANPTVRSILEGLQARITALRASSLARPGRSGRMVEEVREIVEAVEAGDGERAAAASVRHVEAAARAALQAGGGAS